MNLKKTLTFSLLALSVSMVSAQDKTLSDIESSPYKQAIESLYEKNIISGYPDGSFGPNKKINRAEFLKIIIELQSTKRERDYCFSSKNFTDTNAEQWFFPYVCVAVNKGIIEGYDDNSFRPNNSISFVEAAKIITLAFGHEVDDNEDSWYAGAVQELSDKKAIPLSIGSLEKEITREEMAEIVWRIKAQVNNKKSQTFLHNRLISVNNGSSTSNGLTHQQRQVFIKICQKRTSLEPLSNCISRMIKENVQ